MSKFAHSVDRSYRSLNDLARRSVPRPYAESRARWSDPAHAARRRRDRGGAGAWRSKVAGAAARFLLIAAGRAADPSDAPVRDHFRC